MHKKRSLFYRLLILLRVNSEIISSHPSLLQNQHQSLPHHLCFPVPEQLLHPQTDLPPVVWPCTSLLMLLAMQHSNLLRAVVNGSDIAILMSIFEFGKCFLDNLFFIG